MAGNTASIIEYFTQIAREKNVNPEFVLETIKKSLGNAAAKYLGEDRHVDVVIDRETNEILMQLKLHVVEDVVNEDDEIGLEEARLTQPKLKLGDDYVVKVDINSFGRNLVQTLRQDVVKLIREAERDKIYTDYFGRKGELISGTVQQVDRGNILVNLGRTEGIVPFKEQIKGEKYRQGDSIRAYILNVENKTNGAQVILSRTNPKFLEKLFELEVPEIFDKIVEIRKAVRDPGKRAKIIVRSKDERIDPVGACVGMKGNRVQAIVRELSGERIDIINYSDDLDTLVRRVFNPVEIKKLHRVGKKKLVLLIAQESLAQAIGKSGQNINLASELLDQKLDVFGEQEFAEKTEAEQKVILTPEPEPEPEPEVEYVEEYAEGDKPAEGTIPNADDYEVIEEVVEEEVEEEVVEEEEEEGKKEKEKEKKDSKKKK